MASLLVSCSHQARSPTSRSTEERKVEERVCCGAVGVERRKALLSAAWCCAAATLSSKPTIAASSFSCAAPQVEVSPSLLKASTASVRIADDYDTYAASYDVLDGGVAADVLGFNALRQELLRLAEGNVLEVGIGTGLNLPLYDWSKVVGLVGVDVSSGMRQQACNRAQQLGRLGSQISIVQGDMESLQFPSASFDSVVDTFSLCVVPHPDRALREMRRVVKPGGTVLLLEHSRSSVPPLSWYQDVTAGPVAAMAKGCVWNQKLPDLLSSAGLSAVRYQPALLGLVTLVVAQPTRH